MFFYEEYVGSWSCKLEPAICPPHGNQKEICTRWNSRLGKEEIRDVEIRCSPGICSGCYVPRWFGYSDADNVCIPYGTRLAYENSNNHLEELYGGNFSEDGMSWNLDILSSDKAILSFSSNEYGSATYNLYPGKIVELDVLDEGIKIKIVDILYSSQDSGESKSYITFSIIESYNAYCNYDGRINKQKSVLRDGSWASCQNSYECESNLCSGGNCVEINDMIAEVSGMKSLGVKVLCKLADLFGIDNYEQCIYDSLGEK